MPAHPKDVFSVAASRGAIGLLKRSNLFSTPLGRSGLPYEETTPEMHAGIPRVRLEFVQDYVLRAIGRVAPVSLKEAISREIAAGFAELEERARSGKKINFAKKAAALTQHVVASNLKGRARLASRIGARLERHLGVFDFFQQIGRSIHAQEVIAALFAANIRSPQRFKAELVKFRQLEKLLRLYCLKKIFAGAFGIHATFANAEGFHKLYAVLNNPNSVRRYTTYDLASSRIFRRMNRRSQRITNAVSVLSRLGFAYELPPERVQRSGSTNAFSSFVGGVNINTKASIPHNNVHWQILRRLYLAKDFQLPYEQLVKTFSLFDRTYGVSAGLRGEDAMRKARSFLERKGLVRIAKVRNRNFLVLTSDAAAIVSDSVSNNRFNPILRERLLQD